MKTFGLFQDSNAHHLVVSQFATLFGSMNERFDRERFMQACRVELVDHSNDEPIRKVCPNKFAK